MTARATSGPAIPKQVAHVNLLAAMSLSAAAALLIAMGEIDRLSGDVLDAQGRSWPFSSLMGPSRLVDLSSDGWTAGTGTYDGGLDGWLRIYVALDWLFVALYAFGLHAWFRERCPAVARLVVAVATADALENVLAFIVGRPEQPSGDAGLLPTALPGISWTKWAIIAMLLAVLLRRFLFRPTAPGLGSVPWPDQARMLARSLFTQRFSLLPLLPLLFLSLLPGPNIADQLPDVQRRWLDGSPGARHGVLAALSLLVLAVVVFVLGRLRSDLTFRLAKSWAPAGTETQTLAADVPGAERDTDPADGSGRPDPVICPWIVGPLVVAVVGVGLTVITGTAGLDPVRLTIFAGIPLVIGLASLRLGRLYQTTPDTLPAWGRRIRVHMARQHRILDEKHINPVIKAGDTLAVLALAIGGLGLVRSFTAVVLLESSAWAWALLLGGAVVAVGVWPIAMALMDRVPDGPVADVLTPGRGNPDSRPAKVLRVGLLALCTAGYVVLGLLPLPAATGLGVIASVTAAMTLLTGMIASLVAVLQYGGAPYVFWFPWLRLRAAPVVSLLVITVLWASSAGGESNVHGVRGLTAGTRATSTTGSTTGTATSTPASTQAPPTGSSAPEGRAISMPQRPSLNAAFTAWLGDPDACRRKVSSQQTSFVLRPMVMVAAEGGGIRAAYWAAAAQQLMSGYTLEANRWSPPAEGKGCGARSVLFSAGASGGALGLTVTRFAAPEGQPTPTMAAAQQVEAMAAPEALGAGAIGLLVRDVVYASTGLPLPSLGFRDDDERESRGSEGTRAADGAAPPRRWVDRAGLMETAWEYAASGLSQPFLPAAASPTANTASGHLAFGSTSMTTGCRMIVSQLALGPSRGAAPQAQAGAPSAQGDAPVNGACSELWRPAPNSVDLFADYDPANGTTTDRGCLGNVSAVTAAMLASRFPYVTPSGVVGPCGPWPTQQLVDGGYTENTGLGTIIDLADQWLPLVQQHNTRELRLAALTRTAENNRHVPELVVPLVVYLDNGTGSDLLAPTRKVATEILVPPVGRNRAGSAQADAPALLQRAADVAATSRLWEADVSTQEITDAVNAWRHQPVVVVNQNTHPAITAPLGWVLSQASITTMNRGLSQSSSKENRCKSEGAQTNAICANGFGTLADALAILDDPQ